MSRTSITELLLVEDNPGDARLLREMLNEQGTHNTELTHVQYMSDAEKHLAEHTVDIILLDLGLPDAQGLEAVRRARTAAPRVPLVVLTGLDDESLAAQALQEGAQDYLIKGQIDDARAAARPALCHRAQDHGRGAVRGKGTRPGHAQQHRRRRRLHGHLGKHHLPQSRRGEDDGLVAAGGGRPAHGRSLPHPGHHESRSHPESDGDGGWARPNRAPAVELHPHPA